MGEADFEASQRDLLGARGTAAVEEDERLAAAVRQHLDVAPADPADARPECLHHSFLGGEAGGQLRHAPTAMADLVVRIDALEEAVTVPREHISDAVDLDDVDADGKLRGHPAMVRKGAAWRSAGYAVVMEAAILDGAAIAADVRAEVAATVAGLRARGRTPGLAAVLVGDNAASISYVGAKAAACSEVGIFSETFHLPATTTQDALLGLIRDLNADRRFHGILPQLPLPPQIDERTILDAIDPAKDVDGLHPVNLGRLLRGETTGPIPCTPHGVQQLLVRSGRHPDGKHVVVVGRSTLVGRPLAVLLSNKAPGANATVTICHTGTPDVGRHTRAADIIVLAAGRPNTLTADMVRPGAVVIDVGTNRVDDATRKRGWRLVGDADFAAVRQVASAITPVPGGVGPMTIAMLLVNTATAAGRA